MRRPHERIPLAGTSGLRATLRRSLALRLGLAAALVAALAGTLTLALRRPELPTLLPKGSEGVIVLDVSGSIGPREYRQLGQALDEAASEDRRYGLVAFSDVAYEVFPPVTDRAQLQAIRRFFVPAKRAKRREFGTSRAGGKVYLGSPWTAAFSGGTRISFGLNTALDVIRRDELERPTVLLISDLDYDPRDGGLIEQALADYRRERITLRIVALGTARGTEEFFQSLDQAAGVRTVRPVGSVASKRSEARVSASEPLLLGAACVLLLLLVATNELVCGRLTWSPREAR